MSSSALISCAELQDKLDRADWAVVDCRFALDDTKRGRRAYPLNHIPGAIYAHLDEDLSGPVTKGVTGRHPLPRVETIAATFSSWGIDEHTHVVAYDDSGGAIAARLWWLLRWLGHDRVYVLDGGLAAWEREGRPLRSGIESRTERTFQPKPRDEMIAECEVVAQRRLDPDWKVIDAREDRRYRGEFEPIDPVAGHIPGAVNAPHPLTVGTDGRYRSPEDLRRHFEALLGGTSPGRAIVYCGSGVTATRNLLAMVHAGLDGARLYPGSWSEWITDPSRPIATGETETCD